jgi:Phytanoyl-CoA dioxygenase (PhyH)
MSHSLVQQVLRMDPVIYALMAAGRPDHNTWLVSYPYVAKCTSKGQHTEFLHTDTNIVQLVEDGVGRNKLTSSISLDDEDENGCTKVVPGMHHKSEEWLDKMQDSANPMSKDTLTSDFKKHYDSQDWSEFGKPVPVPCGRFDFRMSLPEIIHGSTKYSQKMLRVIYTWLTGIDEDHIMLDNLESLDWEGVASCLRDLMAPTIGVSGDSPRSLEKKKIEAAVMIQGVSPLCDALVGRRKWTDEWVISDRDTLLGDDEEESRAYVEKVRGKLVEAYREAFAQLEKIERKVFREKSFFLWRDSRKPAGTSLVGLVLTAGHGES